MEHNRVLRLEHGINFRELGVMRTPLVRQSSGKNCCVAVACHYSLTAISPTWITTDSVMISICAKPMKLRCLQTVIPRILSILIRLSIRSLTIVALIAV